MKLVVDGVIFQKDPHGGIARLYRETLPRLCDLEPALTVHLFTDGPLQAGLPVHARIRVHALPPVRLTLRPRGPARRMLYPLRRIAGTLWNRLRQPWFAPLSDGIWHSTYYSLPDVWRGPQVVTVYDLIPERFPELYNDPLDEVGRRRKRRCIELADRVICISQATRDLVQNWYGVPDERLVVVYPACSPIFRAPAMGETWLVDGVVSPYLLYVGGRAGYKNFTLLLDAFSRWSRRDDIMLVCVGPAWQMEEKRLLAERGLGDRVTLLQGMDDERLRRLYHRALGFVYPSREEGFGIPLLEAMACACPVIAARIPSTLEVAGDIPITFDPTAAGDLLNALDRLLTEDLEARRTAGLQRVKDFSWEKTAQGALAVYRSISVTREDPA